MKYFDNNGAIVEDDQNITFTFEDHGMIEYVNSGHIVRIFYERQFRTYSVEIDDIDTYGALYTSQREAREEAAYRIKNGRIEG